VKGKTITILTLELLFIKIYQKEGKKTNNRVGKAITSPPHTHTFSKTSIQIIEELIQISNEKTH
jgi:hypothetical protein